ncbi:GntR family transcriptional regulator (plasmid) [Bartonella sp. HY329]|uniref:GntR family transcriptional regulator n=1 Tax=unclassified Bartonella TaxID=2645622 RepID=UPI0021C9EA94|nr:MULTISPECIES: GntR family transcriptional regulator [unclassified Bartonella]UXM96620.1 GntR family transcriptional regulator [Bartonella sp. HY329]UXN10943.1 GntR family transcriptional regulator [Bartonella sp. HY328]
MDKTNLKALAERAKKDDGSLADNISAFIRDSILKGLFKPGAHLSESHLCQEFNISRNTLREAFRNLAKDGLLRHEVNRGVFVIIPDLAAIIDVYTVRRIIECGAILQAHPLHNAIVVMRQAVERAEKFRLENKWLEAGTADIEFHSAIVSLAGSKRLSQQFEKIMVELRLIFGLLDDPQFLHAPYISLNQKILTLVENGDYRLAASELEQYLLQAERMILATYAQKI